MRGKEAAWNIEEQPYRITPAYAGKRRQKQVNRTLYGDHPRVCGEKPPEIVLAASWLGSPPRMRGKEAAHDLDKARRGITPAYAGKSQSFGQAPGR